MKSLRQVLTISFLQVATGRKTLFTGVIGLRSDGKVKGYYFSKDI